MNKGPWIMALRVTFSAKHVLNMDLLRVWIVHLLIVFACVCVDAQVRLRESDIVLVNRPISVPVGGQVTIDPVNHLRIHVRAGDTCVLTVMDKHDLAYSGGKLNAATYPCMFGSHMQYAHYGSQNWQEDKIRLLLRYDSTTETLIIPITLVFNIVNRRLEIVERNEPITVTHHMGRSSPIDASVLRFRYDTVNTKCRVSVISQSSGLPKYGYLVNDTNALTNVECYDFLSKGILYKHHAQANTPNKDYIPIMVEIFRENGEVIKQEYFQVVVNIRSGKKNTRPEPAQSALFLMDAINQFVMTAMTPEIVSAYDEETSSDQLLFKITQPLGPREGKIVSTDERDIPITSFYQYEINELKIAYRPPSTDSSINRMFQLELTIFDPEGLSSDPIPLMIIVNPMNTLAPVVTTNTGIQLIEGQSRPIVSPSVLEISDEDNLEDVKIFHIDGLRHGHLVLPANKKYFTPADLQRGDIVYQHDDSDTFSDNIIFRMTDGKNDVEFLFPVTIFPKDDHAPVLTVNTGVEIRKGAIIEINQFVLSASDIDSDDAHVKFILQPDYSKEGVVIKRQFQMPEDVDNWQFNNGVYEKVVTEFTQEDIMEGKLFYRHVGDSHPNVVIDKLRFTLLDGGDPPNRSHMYDFFIKIQPVDDKPPYLYSNIKLQVELEESQPVHFRRRNLRYSDDETDDRQIQYTITQAPHDTHSRGPSDAGRLSLCEKPNKIVTSFTQAQVNHHKICYQPPTAELGIATRVIQFDFKVEDMSGNTIPDQQYKIIIKPVNNQPPIVTNAGATLFENQQVMITTDMLNVEDKDTPDRDIIIIVTRVPKHGYLYNRRLELSVNDKFQIRDVAAGSIVYRNIGDAIEVTEDEFRLDVTDGVHHVPINFKIKIRPADDEPATLEGTGQAGQIHVKFEVSEGRSFIIGKDNFRISDPDTDVMEFMYYVRGRPTMGDIMVSGRKADRFTQRDIIEGKVVYKHTSGEIGPDIKTDNFELMLGRDSNVILSDGSRAKDIQATIIIMPMDTVAPTIIAKSKLDVLEGDKNEILPIHIDVQDTDSNAEDVLCTILNQPNFGYIENKSPIKGSEVSRMGMPISAFSIKDLRAGNILYVQSIHKDIEPRQDQFEFQCTDGRNLSPQARLEIQIHPANDEVPVVHVREFTGSEGMDIHIDLPIFSVVDKDTPEDILSVIITKPPKHGAIIKQSRSGDHPVMNFTFNDIKINRNIVYKHDDSETQSDKVEFLLTDGKHNVTTTVPIIIFPVDDETPRLTINNGLEIDKLGDRKFITNDILKAEDVDSYIGNITFIIRRVPEQGYLVKNFRTREQNLTLGSNFTQIDIDNMIILYCHTGLEAKRDLIKFDVTDGLNPLIDRYFYVTVKGMDTIYPEVINRGIELPEGGIAVLNTEIISGTDLNSPDEHLQFTVTRAPSHGYLDFSDRQNIPILRFTQLDLAAARVRYVHSSQDEIRMDSFEFEVTDGYNPVSRTFRIALTDIDNKLPVLMYSKLHLKEGSSKLITPFELKAVDMDTPEARIVFTITQVPLHGNLLYNISKIVSRFTLHDLNQNLITYQHDGTETQSDSFTFTVSDGTHSQFFISGSNIPTRRPQEMDIEIIPIDNGVPQISINVGATSLSPIDGGIGFQFTNRILRSDDLDTMADSLQYSLSVTPEHGFIRNIAHGRGGVTSWTQGDIDRMQILYVLNPGENATADSFFFQVADKGGNVLANQPFHLNWGWISFKQSHITVNETQDMLEIILTRRGYLGETCFITVNVTDRTAMVGKDVSRQFAQQVQFNPGQMEKIWRLPIRDDNIYEHDETIIVQLTEPVSAVLEYPDVAMVTIVDPEDESTVVFPSAEYRVSENVTQLDIPVHRTGDLSQEMMVICYTRSGTARGTPPKKVQSYSDYISRGEDHNSMVRFDKNEDNKFCTVTIIDDRLYEDEENFYVVLARPMGGKVGEVDETSVVILPDPADDTNTYIRDPEPVFYFDEAVYNVDESVGTLEVKVWKTGTDLSRPSSVTIRSRRTEPASAEAGIDYMAVIRILDFSPGEMTKTLQVTILDDLGQPVLEGVEKFELHLRMPVGGSVGEPSIATVYINDTQSDLPSMEFGSAEYEVKEPEGHVVATVIRTGDISHESRVRCFTRQLSAKVTEDFEERPDTNASFVIFPEGSREAECKVKIVNDKIREDNESFRLVLGTPDSAKAGGATLGGQDTARVVVTDDEDRPVIMFEHSRFTVNEPIIKGDMNILKIPVIRQGDTSATSEVRVSTKSGSASAGRDFNAYSHKLVFKPGIDRLFVEIQINYDKERESHELFSVHLSNDHNMIAEVNHNRRATIYIEEKSKLANVIFPSPPLVVSLKDLDHVGRAMNGEPVQGYPLVCVSPCSPKHPKYLLVKQICENSGINDTITKYRWRVGTPADDDGVSNSLRDLETNTFFTTTRHVTLDSIYFGPGSRVQCFARAVNRQGEPGKELESPIVEIDRSEGLCLPRSMESVGADPFTAKLKYTGPDDPHHPNTVRVTIQIPHSAGMLPAISTRRLSNFELALSADGFRTGQHRCSNLLDVYEVPTKYGFITNATKMSKYTSAIEPYQFSDELRDQRTLRFYKNLDLESCLWTFEGYYGMSELVSDCGGLVETDAQMDKKLRTRVMNSKQSYVSLKIPLYVTYLYHSASPTTTWRNFDMSTYLNLKFVYDTSILWQEGVRSPQDEDGVYGYLFPTSMRIQDDGKLVVNFRSEARFRGQFVKVHLGSDDVSEVVSTTTEDKSIKFSLSLIRSDPTFDKPHQSWEFVSNMAMKDYSGDYKINLIPCIASMNQEYSLPIKCTPGDLVTFDLPIRFQQVSDPVPAKFSLNTQFHLVRKRDLWLSDGSLGFGSEEDAAFAPGDIIYGRVDVDPVQALGSEFRLDIEKVFLCSGKDGYIPKYDPENGEYGCVAESTNLDRVFRIVDAGAPYTEEKSYNGLEFKARMAADDPSAKSLLTQPGADGFSFDSSPLFQADTGRQWFLHTIYTVRSSENSPSNRGKRKTQTFHMVKRAVSDVSGIGEAGKGTNMAPLILNFHGEAYDDQTYATDEFSENKQGRMTLILVLIGVGSLLLIVIFVLVIFIRHRRKQTSPPPTPSGTITVMSGSGGQTRIVSNGNGHLLKSSENTEV